MKKQRIDQLRALSALSSVALCLHDLATRDHSNANEIIQKLLPSIQRFNADYYTRYFPCAEPLEVGRLALIDGLKSQDFAPFRMLPALVALEKRFARRSDLVQKLRAGLERHQYQVESLGLEYPEQRALLSGLYRDVITENLGAFKIYGRQDLLQKEERVQQIRVLLLLGLRASALWRQAGGGVWTDFLWSRKKLELDLTACRFEDDEVVL